MKPSDRLEYELYKLKAPQELAALIRRARLQGMIYLACGLAVALAVGLAALKGWSR